MADETRWEDVFSSQPGAHPDAQPTNPPAPQSRREAREARQAGSRGPKGPRNARSPRDPRPPHRWRRWVAWVVAVVAVLGLAAGAAGYVWLNYEEQVRKVLGWELPPPDYVGEGSGEAMIVIVSGDTGVEVTNALLDAGVIKSFDTFYTLLLAQDPASRSSPVLRARREDDSQAALDASRTRESRGAQPRSSRGQEHRPVFGILSTATELPVEDFVAAAKDPTSYGAPPEAPSLEGYLFPATYHFDPGVDARTVLQTLVDRTFQSLDAAGVAPADRHRVLTMAALIQREAGRDTQDFYKVSRVFNNLLDNGWHLESDATVSYGTGRTHTVWTTPAERADTSNPYNTYANPGLPIGPIGAAGDLAIDAALHPADGPWFYFVPVNLDTGETVFSTTLAEHNAAVRQLQEWCRETQSPNCD